MSRSLCAAIMFVASTATAFAQAGADKLEAVAGVKQPLVEYARTDPNLRVMDGRFMVIQQAMGTPKGRDAGARYLRMFIEEMKASGFGADGLKRSNQPDAVVAPPSN